MQRSARLPPLFFILGTTLVGSISGHVSGDLSSLSLATAPFPPPAFLLSLLSPLLCGLTGCAAFLVWRNGTDERYEALYWFVVQLGLFFLWSPLLLRYGLCWAALLTLAAQCLLALYTMEHFRLHSIAATRLLIPYFLWLLYLLYYTLGAALLN